MHSSNICMNMHICIYMQSCKIMFSIIGIDISRPLKRYFKLTWHTKAPRKKQGRHVICLSGWYCTSTKIVKWTVIIVVNHLESCSRDVININESKKREMSHRIQSKMRSMSLRARNPIWGSSFVIIMIKGSERTKSMLIILKAGRSLSRKKHRLMILN